ncbi:MAG: hypothetical protein KBT02_11000 [Treponema sp.]|nr:hypothetical protein [Candidatus Treponema caballi]
MKHTLFVSLLCALFAFCLVSCTSYKAAEAADRALLEQLEGPDALNAFTSSVEFPALTFDAPAGTSIAAEHSGYVKYASSNAEVAEVTFDIPAEFSHGVIIFEFEEEYYYKGKKRSVTIEAVYFNVLADEYLLAAFPERPIHVESGEHIGYTLDDAGVILRCTRPSEYLVSCARVTPKYDGKDWYFGAECLVSTIPKFLLFQPVASRKDEVTFHTDGLSETLEQITNCSEADDCPCSYPTEPVRFMTQLAAYPETTGYRSSTELLLRNSYFNGMNLDVTVDVDGLSWHFMFPDYFLDYLTDEYTLGDDIYLYGYICYSLDGELYLYGRDFTLYDPDDEVDAKLKSYTYANFGDNSLR